MLPPNLPIAHLRPIVPHALHTPQRRKGMLTVIQEDTTAESATQPAEATRRADFDRYFAVRTHFGNLAFSPDGSQVAYIVNTSGQFNVWRQAVVGGWASQVTTFEREAVRGIIWTPAGEII